MFRHICGCYYFDSTSRQRHYLPQVKIDAHTTILSTASRTVLKQKFINASKDELEEIRYAFPLFDGVSVVDFVCTVGDRTIYGLVKEKSEARKTYEEAKGRGEKAALLEQLPNAADVFTTSISNIPKSSSVEVSITYIQELKHDAEVDGVRLTVPTSISPRYGSYPGKLMTQSAVDDSEGMSLTIDVCMAEGIPIKKILSPSHSIEVSLGSLSTSTIDEDPSLSKASATLSLGTTQLEKDFVLQVVAKDVGVPQAILEIHPSLPNQRALMTTLVPRFNLKSQKPEIIFIVDRSGSMSGNITTLRSALKVFLKSIPVGCMFNICSFGSTYSFLWPTSQLYSQDTLAEAIKHVSGFRADFGGTETLSAVKGCFKAQLKEMPTELMLLTDGDIWSQQQVFDYISEQTAAGDVRVFPIGIGGSVSSALIEGIARAGHGFGQMVANNEKLDSKIVRMLKGALTPHIKDYRLEVRYDDGSVDSVTEGSRIHLQFEDGTNFQSAGSEIETAAKPISLYDTDTVEEHPKSNETTDIFAGLPKINRPSLLQAPHKVPPLFSFNRTCVYLLLSPAAANAMPKSVVLKGTSPQGPLELEIPVEVRKVPDQMIHQLAARKATQELEEGRGWITSITTEGEKPGETLPISKRYPVKTGLLQRREAVRLGVEFQIGGKYSSFVAVEANEAEIAKKREQAINATIGKVSGEEIDDWDIIDYTPESSNFQDRGTSALRNSVRGRGSRPAGMAHSSKPMKQFLQRVTSAAAAAPIVTGLGSPLARRVAGETASRPAAVTAYLRSSASPSSIPVAEESQEEEEEEDDSDEEMGFALFDGPTPPANNSAQSSGGPGRFLKSTADSDSEDETAAAENDNLLESIIAQQSFEGSWVSVSSLLKKKMGINFDDYRKAIDDLVLGQHSLDRGKAEVALGTAIVVVYLKEKLSEEEDTWELVVEKAKSWLEDDLDEEILEAVWAAATGLVQA